MKGRYTQDTAPRYGSYIPKSIKINVLLTPGIITPADIINPEIIKNKKLYSVVEVVARFFSKITKNIPIKSENKVKIK